jgi:hypothetical protein
LTRELRLFIFSWAFQMVLHVPFLFNKACKLLTLMPIFDIWYYCWRIYSSSINFLSISSFVYIMEN